MAETTDSLVLEYLRRLSADVGLLRDGFQDMRARFGSLEEQVAGLRRDVVRLEHRIDQFDDRLRRIERRLDLTEA